MQLGDRTSGRSFHRGIWSMKPKRTDAPCLSYGSNDAAFYSQLGLLIGIKEPVS